jgi:hypothetical protein
LRGVGEPWLASAALHFAMKSLWKFFSTLASLIATMVSAEP